MTCPYLKIFGLLIGGAGLAQAQDLPATVHVRPHSWYLSANIAMLQTQHFESNSPVLKSAANDPQPALGLRLGYSHSPALALETGFQVLPNSTGFVADLEQLSIPRTYKNSQVYLPVTLVFRVWQPAPRLVVRALVGGGMYLQNRFNSYIDTLEYASVPGGLWDSKLLLSHQHTGPAMQYAAEVGLRAEWQASSKAFVGFEIKDLVALSAADDNVISLTDETTRAVLANARMSSRRQTLSAGINVRYIIQLGTSYRYQPVQ